MALGPNDPKQRSASGFTNLQRVLGASSQNKLGQAVGSGISNVAGQAKSGIQQAQSQFQQQAQANRLGTDENKQAQENILGKASSGQDLSDKEVEQFQPMFQGRYGGPTEIAQGQADQIQQKATEAQQLGKGINDSGGRYGLLQRFAASGPQYTSGQSRLDNLLLGQTGQKQLQQARRATTGLEQQAQNTINSAQQQGQTYQNEAKQFGQETQQKLQGQVGNLQQQAQSQAQQKETEQGQAISQSKALQDKIQRLTQEGGTDPLESVQDYATKLRQVSPTLSDQDVYNEYSKTHLNPEDFQKLGVTENTLAKDVNYGSLLSGLQNLTPSQNKVDPLSTMTPQQKAQALALNRLSGSTEGYNPLGVNQDSQVGNYQAPQLYDASLGAKATGEDTKNQFNQSQNARDTNLTQMKNQLSGLGFQGADALNLSQQLANVSNPAVRSHMIKSALLNSKQGKPIFDDQNNVKQLTNQELSGLDSGQYGTLSNQAYQLGQGSGLYDAQHALEAPQFRRIADLFKR